MLTSRTVAPDPFGQRIFPDARWRSLVGPWTDECPDPDHCLKTTGFEYARSRVEEALRSGPGPILVSGPTGHGKTMLLRSLRAAAPSGYSPILVPFSNVEPHEVSRWIAAHALQSGVGDPALELTSLIRAHARTGAKTLLMMDEIQSTSPATLAKLFEELSESDVAVSVVLAGLSGMDLDGVLAAVPLSIRKIEIADPWQRFDVELLLENVALALAVPVIELIAAIDVDAAIRTNAGNPRLVRAELDRQLRFVYPAWSRSSPIEAAKCLPPATSSPRAFVPLELPMPIPIVERMPSDMARSTEADEVSPAEPLQRRRASFALRRSIAGMVSPLGRAGHEGWAALTRGAGVVRRDGGRMGRAARARLRAGRVELRSWSVRSAAFIQSRVESWSRFRSRTLAGGVAQWNGLLRGLRRFQSAIAVIAQSLYQRRVVVSMYVHGLLREGYRLARFRAVWGLLMACTLVALGTSMVDGRIPIRPVVPPSGRPGAEGVDRILFRLNSHPWATVEVDGVNVGSTPLSISLEPGTHRFRVVMADGYVHDDDLVVSTVSDHHAFRSGSAIGSQTPRNHSADASP